METKLDFFSPERQALIGPYEAADRSAVGFTMDYPDGLESGLHSHTRAQLIYGITGIMHVTTPDALFMLPPTKALFLPAGAMHSIAMEGRVSMREVFINAEIALTLASEPRILAVRPLLRELILAICEEPVDWDMEGRTPHIVALILDEIRRSRALMTRLPLPRDGRLLKVARAIIAEPADTQTLGEWANRSGTSDRTLARLFIRETGMTFGQWRLQARLNAAFSMLMTSKDIARVAHAVGFASQSALGVAFKRTFGLTPGEVRTLFEPD